MIRVCDICGKEENERLMESISFGRKKEWWCWECYCAAQREATFSDKHRQKKLYKIHQARKRYK